MKLSKILVLFSLLSCFCSPLAWAQQSAAEKAAVPLSLSEAIEKSLANNYGIILSGFDQEVASINNSWGQAGRYPSLDLSMGSSNSLSTNSSSTSGSNRLTGGVGMRWVLFNGFKVQLTKEKLESLEELAQGYSAVVVENTIQDVIEAYYTTLLQLERKKVYQKVMELSADRYRAEEQKKEFGGSVSYQVLQAKNLFLGDQYSLLNQELQVKTAMRYLNFLLAESPDASWVLSDPFEHQPENYSSEELLAKVTANNFVLKNQFINIQIKAKDRQIAGASYFPNLSLSTGLDNSFSNQFIPGQGNSTSAGMSPYANLTLSYNIYSGGSRQRAKQIAEINETIAKTESSEMEHLVSNQVLNELDAYRIRKTQLEVATEGIRAAELNLGIAEEKLRAGTINSFNYRDIQLIYLNAALQRIQAIYALIQSHTNLTRLTGGFAAD